MRAYGEGRLAEYLSRRFARCCWMDGEKERRSGPGSKEDVWSSRAMFHFDDAILMYNNIRANALIVGARIGSQQGAALEKRRIRCNLERTSN